MDVDGRVLRIDTSVLPTKHTCLSDGHRVIDCMFHYLKVQQSACSRNAIGLGHKQRPFPPEAVGLH